MSIDKGNPYGELPEVPESMDADEIHDYLMVLRERIQEQLNALWICLNKCVSVNPSNSGGAKSYFSESGPKGTLEDGQMWFVPSTRILSLYDNGAWRQVGMV